MKFLKRGFKETLEAVKQNKLQVIGLFLLQIFFIILLIYVTMIYSVKIINGIQQVIEPVQQVNYGDDQQDIFNQLYPIYESYAQLKGNLLGFAGWLAGLFLVFQGLLWTLSHKVIGARKLGKILVKYLVTTSLGILLFVLLAYSVLSSITIDNLKMPLIVLGIVSLLMYFLFINFLAFLNTDNWKGYFRRVLSNLKKIQYSLLVFAINIILLGMFTYLIYLGRNYFLLGSLSTAILVVLLVLSRIFWISCLNEKNNH